MLCVFRAFSAVLAVSGSARLRTMESSPPAVTMMHRRVLQTLSHFQRPILGFGNFPISSIASSTTLSSTQNPQSRRDQTGETWITKPHGPLGTIQWRMFFYKNEHEETHGAKNALSPWHDIPYKADDKPNGTLYHYVNEIPKGTRAKFELCTKEEHNPLKQDIKNGALREFKYGDIPFNYGAIPQTWEDPAHRSPETGCKGDNDPVDVVEISNEPVPIGKTVAIKIIGALAMIDEGETDWKILAVHEHSPLFNIVNDEESLEMAAPGFYNKICDWFINYKVPDGKPQNVLAFNGHMRDAKFATNIVEECHDYWLNLVNSGHGNGLWLPRRK